MAYKNQDVIYVTLIHWHCLSIVIPFWHVVYDSISIAHVIGLILTSPYFHKIPYNIYVLLNCFVFVVKDNLFIVDDYFDLNS